MDTKRIRQAWHATPKGFDAALSLLSLAPADLPDATPTTRAVAVLLSWHLSSSACTAPTAAIARQLTEGVAEHVASHGWTGSAGLCCGGEHFVVGTESHAFMWAPSGCGESTHIFALPELHHLSQLAVDAG